MIFDTAKALQALLGLDAVLTRPEDLAEYGRDWTRSVAPRAAGVVLPRSTTEVSQCLTYFHEHRIPVVPSGGRTGLAGGAVASGGEWVLSLERMRRILEVCPLSMSIDCEAGVTTEALQKAADDAGYYYPVDLASKGSCQIGGNVATNAGGLKVIRYGHTRDAVLGLEVVLADGTVLNMMRNLRKDNSGYDLKHLFIASEGTLGVITRARIRMVPRPRTLDVGLVGARTFDEILGLLRDCQANNVTLTAMEFFAESALNLVLKHHTQHCRDPFAQRYPYYVLIEVERPQGQSSPQALEELLGGWLERGWVQDALVADSTPQTRGLWALRENISEAIQKEGHVRKNDIALPISKLGVFLKDLGEILKSSTDPRLQIILFGHIGDGNLHLNYSTPTSRMTQQEFARLCLSVEAQVFECLAAHGGSISAEHGIGLLKKQDLLRTRSHLELGIMAQVKQLLDPRGILNPGKILP